MDSHDIYLPMRLCQCDHIVNQFARMDFNHRSPPHRQNGNNSNNFTSNFHERSPYSNNDSSSMLHHINNTPKQKQTLNSETFYQHQHPSIYNSSNTKSSRRNLMERRRAKSECLSPSHSPNHYQSVKSHQNRDHQPDAWSAHRSPRQLTNPVEDELDLDAEYNFPSWHPRNRYRASSESSSDYYYFRDNFPDIEDYRNKRSRDMYSMSPGKYRSASHQSPQQQNHRVTNKSSFSVLVNNSNHHQYRHSPKLKARSHYMSHKTGIVRVSSPLHKKRLEMWKSQSQSTNSNHSNHSNSNSSIPSNSIPSIDSHSATFTPKISPDDDDEDLDEEEEDPPGPEDQVDDDDMTDPEDTYESSLSLSYSERSLPALTLNTDCVLGGRVPGAPFSQSLFPFVPPYITFASFEEKGPEIPAAIHKQLKWKLTTITPLLVRKILLNTGFRLMKTDDPEDKLAKYEFLSEPNDWVGTWAKHMKSPCFKTLHSYQKFNHLPGSFQIGRKDRCWRNLQGLMARHGKKEFGFMPRTFIIPQDLNLLRQSWHKFSQKNTKWIIKPPASARGTGIKVVSSWSQIPKKKPLIVQRYIERPLLINGSKFDLRLYILVTSMNPLRVYLHTDGLARFASVKYSEKVETLNDRYMHLTNYSINKLSNSYDKNDDANACKGMKWTIKSLWSYLEERGVNTKKLWGALRNLVLRTVLAGEGPINSMIKTNLQSKYNSFELFGIDVILDNELVPWLLEVNISPSLHSASNLDMAVKGPLVTALLNTVMFQIPPKIPLAQQTDLARDLNLKAPLCYDKRIYVTALSKEERLKHQQFVQKGILREDYINAILENLTPDDVRCLILTEDELARCAPLERIFPAPNSHKYLQFTEQARYYNLLLDAWEHRYSKKREAGISLLRTLCWKRIHLKVPPASMQKDCDSESPASAGLDKIIENDSSEESSSTITTLTNSTSNSSSPETLDSIEIRPVFIKSNENRDTSNVVTSADNYLIRKSSPPQNDCFSNIVNCLPSIAADSEILVRQ